MVVGEVDCAQSQTSEWWSSAERTLGGGNCSSTAWPLPHGGVVAFAEAYRMAPELVTITATGEYRVVQSFATPASRAADFTTGALEPVRWRARWRGDPPAGWSARRYRPVPAGHGHPCRASVWAYRNAWHGRLRGAKVLTDHGCALFYPNPRGSSGRGQAFARWSRVTWGARIPMTA